MPWLDLLVDEVVVTVDAGHAGFAGFLVLALAALALRLDRGLFMTAATGHAVVVAKPITHRMSEPRLLVRPDRGVFVVEGSLALHPSCEDKPNRSVSLIDPSPAASTDPPGAQQMRLQMTDGLLEGRESRRFDLRQFMVVREGGSPAVMRESGAGS